MHDLKIYPPNDTTNLTRFCMSNCDKDGSIVSARLASASGAISSSRPIKIEIDRQTDATYVEDIGNRLASYYIQIDNSKLLDFETLVLSSVHRAALYVAEALHAPILPLQILSFAKTWEQALESNKASIAGTDHATPYIWQWNKISEPEQLPEKYIEMMKRAEKIVLVRSTDSGTDCPIEGRIGSIYINSTLNRIGHGQRFFDEIKQHPAFGIVKK